MVRGSLAAAPSDPSPPVVPLPRRVIPVDTRSRAWGLLFVPNTPHAPHALTYTRRALATAPSMSGP